MTTETSNEIFPKGVAAPSEYFTGSAWVKTLLPADEVFNTVIAHVVFEPGARNNWHMHPGGQILNVTDGEGLYQEKGRSAQKLTKGDVVRIPPGILHWHGAAGDSRFSHIAINPGTDKGTVNWLERVTDEEYQAAG